MQVGQMSLHQVKQSFIGSYYHICLGYPEWNSRPFSVQDFLFCFWKTRQNSWVWVAASVQLLAHCLYIPEISFHVQGGPSSRIKCTSRCLHTILGGELTLSAVTLVSVFISSPQYWLVTKGQMLRWLRASHICTQLLWEDMEGHSPSVQITTLQNAGWGMP